MTKNITTVYVGRFNPFHNGHAHVLLNALKTSQLTIILIGSSYQARSLKNPFSFTEREDMIRQWAYANNIKPDAFVIQAVPDYPYNDTEWITQVQRIVLEQDYTDETNIYITGSDRDESTWYLKAFPQYKLSLVPEYRADGSGEFSATKVREILFGENPSANLSTLSRMLPGTTLKFLKSFIGTPEHVLLSTEYKANKLYREAWSVAPYAPIFSTVDAVVIQSGHVLLVQRAASPGKGLWALPGGFLNQTERLQDGAIRELMEETGIRLAEGKKAEELTRNILKGSIKAKEIFDKPDRSSRGRTITTAYLFRLDDTKPLPLVKGQNMPLAETNGIPVPETTNAFWIPISDAVYNTDRYFEDHLAIIQHFIGLSGDR